jgi:hypothetical protein
MPHTYVLLGCSWFARTTFDPCFVELQVFENNEKTRPTAWTWFRERSDAWRWDQAASVSTFVVAIPNTTTAVRQALYSSLVALAAIALTKMFLSLL